MHAFDPRLAGVRRAVPARLLVDAGARGSSASPPPCRRRRAPVDGPRRAARRHARDARSRRAPADDGRRQRRRLPLRRARLALVAAIAHGSPTSAGGGCRRSRSAPRARPTSPPRGGRRRTSAASTTRSLHGRRGVEALPNVVRAIESFDPGLVRSAVPNYMLARTTRQHVKVVLTGEGADELFAGYEYMREFTEDAALHAELERTVALPAQPQPAALRPRDDGARRRGARAVPRPQRDRAGRCGSRRGRSPGHAGEEAAARGVRGLAARRAPVAREGRVRRRLRRPRRPHQRGRGRRSPTRSSRPSAARSSRRCARRRSSRTTASGASTSRASAPSERSAASPAPEREGNVRFIATAPRATASRTTTQTTK